MKHCISCLIYYIISFWLWPWYDLPDSTKRVVKESKRLLCSLILFRDVTRIFGSLSDNYFVCFQVTCIPLFFIQRLCAATRLKFDVTITYGLSRLSLSYPVEVTVHIKHTVTTNATFSAHASTWFLESGVYTTGKTVIGSFTDKRTQEKKRLEALGQEKQSRIASFKMVISF